MHNISTPPVIALINDDSAMRSALGRTLSRAGYKVREGTTGEAEKMMNNGDADLILFDQAAVGNPVPESVRCACDAYPDVPVIVTAPRAVAADDLKELRLNVVDVLGLPIKRRVLLSHIARILNPDS